MGYVPLEGNFFQEKILLFRDIPDPEFRGFVDIMLIK
jgi:hypothetical protein